MTITFADVQFRLSGGAGNADPNASLGGTISSTAIVPATLENLFDNVRRTEADAGDVEYRCAYIRNGHATDDFVDAFAGIGSLDIGVGTSAVGGTETAVADESTSPGGVIFGQADVALGTIPAGSHRAIWVRRTIAGLTPPSELETETITVYGT